MSFFKWPFKDRVLSPDQLNEHGQITDKGMLKGDRYKFGFANILYQSEEAGIGAVHTVIIRALGGTSLHLGIAGGIGSIGSVMQWIGALLLRKYKSNRKAMIAIEVVAALLSFLKFGILLLALDASFATCALWLYLGLGFLLAATSGVQWNIETNWIGDLVPKEMLGWFTSLKWIVAVFGILCFLFFFGKLADLYPNLYTYAGMFLLVGVSHLISILLISTITDRTPKNANFISSGASHHERLNYKSVPLWCYICFFILWAGGRTPLFTFSVPYMLDQFHYGMTQIAFILAIQSVISVIMLFIMGKLTDKFGCRLPLLIVSGTMACCMFLWVSSAWWGITPIIVYQFLSGMAGHTHSLLSVNYGLEIFPDKGRAGYVGFTRFMMGVTVMGMSMVAGYLLTCVEGWSFHLWGATLNHYHLLFACCSIVTMGCIAPLLFVGRRTVHEEGKY